MKKFYQLIKDLHLYIGLFISPIIILFSISAIVLNHNFIDWEEDWQEWMFSVDNKVDKTVQFKIPENDLNDLDYVKDIQNQLNIPGEIANIFKDSIRVYIPITAPGHRISIRADLTSGIAYIRMEQTNFWKKLIWLHKMPGPHNENIRGNWLMTKIWTSAVDLAVFCLLLTSVTGVTLWYYLKNERNTGLIALLIGLLSIASLIIGLII
jgi:hypothetical protein